MKDFLFKIASSIIESDKVEIVESAEEGIKIYTILVPEIEIGKIIGKEGKVINAIRCLCRVKTSSENEKILIKIDKLP